MEVEQILRQRSCQRLLRPESSVIGDSSKTISQTMGARLVQREVQRVMFYDIRPHDTCQSLCYLSITSCEATALALICSGGSAAFIRFLPRSLLILLNLQPFPYDLKSSKVADTSESA